MLYKIAILAKNGNIFGNDGDLVGNLLPRGLGIGAASHMIWQLAPRGGRALSSA